jgi:rare lipoprotein A (peptidoglycan hydrolase)
MSCRWILILTMLALVSCASRPPVYQEQGWASYVADYYTGRPTASGELYYPQAYTAAHTRLAFGTVVRVKNIMNGRTVNVTINDRFPYYPGRIINLSSAAAQEIGIPYMQMGQVEVTAQSLPPGTYSQQQQPAPAYRGHQPQPATAYGGYQQQPAAYPPVQPSGAYTPQPSVYPGYTPSAQGYQVQPPAGSAPSYGRGNTPPGLQTY